jgi:hypothetical protein
MGIFDTTTDLWTTYHASIVFRDKLMGGTPKDPKIIEGWLGKKAGITDEEELRQATLRTLVELGYDVPAGATYAEMMAAVENLAGVKQTEGFRQCEGGLYLESRTVKAMLKESTHILFAGGKWGQTGKGPRAFLAERVFVNPDRILLGRTEPDGVYTFIGHVEDRQGRRATLAYIEYVETATLAFDVLVARDSIKADDWPQIWVHAQENGLGAKRSQGFGRFDIVGWDVVRG